MSSTATPFGLRPAYHYAGGQVRPVAGTWASGYAANVYENTPVTIATDGSIIVATTGAGNTITGVLQGVQYTDAAGRLVERNFWLSGTVGTNVVVWYTADPNIIYEIQGDGSVAQLNIGEQAAVNNIGNGSSTTGLSACTLNTSTLSSSTTNQVVVIGLSPYIDNAWGDAFTVVQVRVNQTRLAPPTAPF